MQSIATKKLNYRIEIVKALVVSMYRNLDKVKKVHSSLNSQRIVPVMILVLAVSRSSNILLQAIYTLQARSAEAEKCFFVFMQIILSTLSAASKQR